MYQYPKDEILVKSVRDGLVDEAHSGFVIFSDNNSFKNLKGEAGDYPFYMRSCAKPLQASLLIDYGMDEFYQMTEEEIALCSASHAGEKVHIRILQGLLDKIGLDESYLKCGIHEPLSKTRQKELLFENYNEILRLSRHSERSEESHKNQAQNDSSYKLSTLFNNCSGKHTMMLGLCKMNGWDVKTYDEPEHPLQVKIKKKIYELCEVKEEYPATTDGCGVPIVSMPLKNMLKGYLNLFTCKKYKKIRNAFLHCPYLIGGEDRTDTKIISKSGLIAKVGAGGLCIVINYDRSEGFIVKVTDCDMKARELVVINLLNELGWADIETDTSIKTLNDKVVGYYEF